MKNSRVAGRLPVFLPVVLSLSLAFSLRAQSPPSPVIEVERLETGGVELRWPSSSVEFGLEFSSSLSPPGSWQSFVGSTTVQGDRVVAAVNLDESTRYYRLRYSDSAPLTILSTSPSHEETGVAVTRKTVFRLSRPLAPDTVLTDEQFVAESGVGMLNIRPQLSKDRRIVTLFYPDGLPSSSRVRVGFSAIDLFDDRGRPIDPDGDGILGGTAQIHFDTLTVASLENTGVMGYVYASESVNGPGDEPMNQPLQGVTITVDGMEETLRATTDENGFFRLQPCPPGRFFVHIDGRTALGSDWPDGAYYPFVGKSWESVPGQTDTLVGGTGNVYLPYIVPDTLQTASLEETTMVEFPESVVNERPELDGVSIEVPPDNLFDNEGIRGGRIGIAPVASDRLPGELPTGLDFPMVITVQTDGPQNFDQPVPARFPNLPDPQTGVILPPGAKTALWSFNHDTGRWEAENIPPGIFAAVGPDVDLDDLPRGR
jgi:hypothetical protein